jgi:hypothetical protein
LAPKKRPTANVLPSSWLVEDDWRAMPAQVGLAECIPELQVIEA